MKTASSKALSAIVVLAAACLAAWYLLKIDYLILASLILLLIGAIFPWLAEKIGWVWHKFSEGLGWVNSKIILTVLFFVFMTLIGVMFRLFSKKTKFRTKPEKSAYDDRDHTYEAKDFELIG